MGERRKLRTCVTKYLFIVAAMAVLSRAQEWPCDPGTIPEWPAANANSPGNQISVLPMESEATSTGQQHFLVVNSNRTQEILQEFEQHADNTAYLRSERIEYLIGEFENVPQYLSHTVTRSCKIRTQSETCIGLAIATLPWEFIGVYGVTPELEPNNIIEPEVSERAHGETCNYGQFVVEHSTDKAIYQTFCTLDSQGAPGRNNKDFRAYNLEANSEYYFSYEAVGIERRLSDFVLFGLPLSASHPVTIECGIEWPGISQEPLPNGTFPDGPGGHDRPRLTTTSTTVQHDEQEQKGKKENDDGLSPGLIALIAVICAVVLAALIMGILLFIYCRRQRKGENKPANGREHSTVTQRDVNPYEQVDLTLAKDNPYAPYPTKHTYERFVSSQSDRNQYAEIPADALEGEESNSQYETLSRTVEQQNGVAIPIHIAPETRDQNNVETSQDNGNDKQVIDIEELYSKPNKSLKKPDELLVENDIYQSGSKKQKSGEGAYEQLNIVNDDGGDKQTLKKEDSILEIVDNDVYNSD